MQDTPNSIIKYDADNNTVIKINQGDIYSQNTPSQNYPKQIKFQDINYMDFDSKIHFQHRCHSLKM